MDDLLIKTVDSFLGEFTEDTQVYSDFLLLTSDFADPECSFKLGEVDFQGQKWPVWLIDCELNLRRAINNEGSDQAILVFSTRGGLEISIPPDVKARSHQRGRIPIGLRHTLIAQTNREWPEEVNRDEWKLVILRPYETLKSIAPKGSLPISRNDLESLIVQAAFGMDVKGQTAPEIITKLFRHHQTNKPLDLEMEIFKGQLALHGIAHPKIINWIAEDPGRSRRFLLTGAMMRVESQSGLIPGWGEIQPLLGLLLENKSQENALKVVDDLIWESWSALHINEKRHLISKVEKKLKEYQTVDLKEFNDMLPRSLRYEIGKTAGSLSKENRANYSPEKLENHLFSGDERESLETLRAMDRVLAWKEKFLRDIDTEKNAIEWMNWYQTEGSFADLAAVKLITERSAKLERETDEVLQGYWGVRSRANKNFAETFISDYEESIYAKDIIGTHKFIDRLILPALEQDERVLIVVLDGLGFPGLIQLSRHLTEQELPSIGVVSNHLATSILPSVTAASRKAIFLGKCPVDPLDSEEKYEEKSKTTEAAALKDSLGAYSVKLHNRTTLSASGGQASLFTDLQNPSTNLVALVLIEVDESLSGGAEPRLWDPEDLGVFLEAVKDALNAGRRVFLVSDHGHTWHIDKGHRQGAQVSGGGQRYIPLKNTEQAPANTITTSDPNILHYQEADRIAFLYRVGDYFGQVPRRGYHGGVGLEEVVIPCVELGYGGKRLISDEEVNIKKEQPKELSDSSVGQSGVVLELPDGRRINLDLSDLSFKEIQILQLIAKHGRINEQQLRDNLKSRRVAGIVSKLMEKLANEGFEVIKITGTGAFGNEYEFREPTNK